MRYQSICFTAPEQAELIESEIATPLNPDEVAGSTLYSLISPGTELAGIYVGGNFPAQPGYAAVFRVESVGQAVGNIREGELRFCMGKHQSYQRVGAADTIPVPDGLAPQLVPFCRLMGVTMTTLQTTLSRPPAQVLVTGLGPVGHLCAQVFAAYGYEVLAVDPVSARRQWAIQAGLTRVLEDVPHDDPSIARRVDLHIECSGHEGAALDGCKVVKKKGEIALVGAPWTQKANIQAHEFLREIFFNYVILRSGWEWELPHHPLNFRQGSIFTNFSEALRLLLAGKVVVEGLYEQFDPSSCQEVYQELLHRRANSLFQIFSWQSS